MFRRSAPLYLQGWLYGKQKGIKLLLASFSLLALNISDPEDLPPDSTLQKTVLFVKSRADGSRGPLRSLWRRGYTVRTAYQGRNECSLSGQMAVVNRGACSLQPDGTRSETEPLTFVFSSVCSCRCARRLVRHFFTCQSVGYCPQATHLPFLTADLLARTWQHLP
jgi:hypothetical protein